MSPSTTETTDQPSQRTSWVKQPLALPLSIALAATALYWFTRAPALDEWDSVQFAQAVHSFNIAADRPHAPGYPLYIFAGWAISSLVRCSEQDALLAASAIGGGLFVAAWFAIARRHFGNICACLLAASLATLTSVWMASTMVMTDALASGLLAATSFAACSLRDSASPPRRIGLALLAALACAARPQNIAIIALIYFLGLARARPADAPRKRWHLQAILFFAAAQLLWFIPLLWTQARLAPGGFDWLYWPRLVLRQWLWRFDKPQIVLGAANSASPLMILRVVGEHLESIGLLSFGFRLSKPIGLLGAALVAAGILFTAARTRLSPAAIAEQRSPFWREQFLWAVPYTLMIVLTLPPDQRYYVPIIPLLVLPLVIAAHALTTQLRAPAIVAAAALLPAAITGARFAVEHHRELPPPVRLIHAALTEEKPATAFYFRQCLRHAQWYAPQLHPRRATDISGSSTVPDSVNTLVTEDSSLVSRLTADGWNSARLGRFKRPPEIHRKHASLELWRLQRGSLTAPTSPSVPSPSP